MMRLRSKENTICGIYCIENLINNKKYIGQSVNIYSRWSSHKGELNRNCHHNGHLQNSWNKYGEDNFKFYIIEKCSKEKLDEREIYYIDTFKTLDDEFGYNDKNGGQDGTISIEANERRSKSLKKYYEENPDKREEISKRAFKQWADPTIKAKILGKNNGMYGRTHTKEARQKISEAQKGHVAKHRNKTPVLCVELNKIFEDAVIACKELGINTSSTGSIHEICRGESKYRKTVGGYHWQYLENNI